MKKVFSMRMTAIMMALMIAVSALSPLAAIAEETVESKSITFDYLLESTSEAIRDSRTVSGEAGTECSETPATIKGYEYVRSVPAQAVFGETERVSVYYRALQSDEPEGVTDTPEAEPSNDEDDNTNGSASGDAEGADEGAGEGQNNAPDGANVQSEPTDDAQGTTDDEQGNAEGEQGNADEPASTGTEENGEEEPQELGSFVHQFISSFDYEKLTLTDGASFNLYTKFSGEIVVDKLTVEMHPVKMGVQSIKIPAVGGVASGAAYDFVKVFEVKKGNDPKQTVVHTLASHLSAGSAHTIGSDKLNVKYADTEGADLEAKVVNEYFAIVFKTGFKSDTSAVYFNGEKGIEFVGIAHSDKNASAKNSVDFVFAYGVGDQSKKESRSTKEVTVVPFSVPEVVASCEGNSVVQGECATFTFDGFSLGDVHPTAMRLTYEYSAGAMRSLNLPTISGANGTMNGVAASEMQSYLSAHKDAKKFEYELTEIAVAGEITVSATSIVLDTKDVPAGTEITGKITLYVEGYNDDDKVTRTATATVTVERNPDRVYEDDEPVDISVRVLNYNSKEPIGGVKLKAEQVYLNGDGIQVNSSHNITSAYTGDAVTLSVYPKGSMTMTLVEAPAGYTFVSVDGVGEDGGVDFAELESENNNVITYYFSSNVQEEHHNVLTFVVKDEDGQPIEGAKIQLHARTAPDGTETEATFEPVLTNAEGKAAYTVTDWVYYSYEQIASADGYEFSSASVDVDVDADKEIEITNTRAARIVTVHVADLNDQPISGITIHVDKSGVGSHWKGLTGTTDEEGNAVFDVSDYRQEMGVVDENPDVFNAHVTDSGEYLCDTPDATVSVGGKVDFVLASKPIVEPEEHYSVSVSVCTGDGDERVGVPGIRVLLNPVSVDDETVIDNRSPLSVETDENGLSTFELTQCLPWNATLDIGGTDWAIVGDESHSITMEETTASYEVVFELKKAETEPTTYTAVVHVTTAGDDSTRVGVSGVQVVFKPVNGSDGAADDREPIERTTDAEGNVTFESEDNLAWTVAVMPNTEEWTVDGEEWYTVDWAENPCEFGFELKKVQHEEPPEPEQRRLTINVVKTMQDSDTVAPIIGASVEIASVGVSGTAEQAVAAGLTDENGQFVATVLPGEYHVTISGETVLAGLQFVSGSFDILVAEDADKSETYVYQEKKEEEPTVEVTTVNGLYFEPAEELATVNSEYTLNLTGYSVETNAEESPIGNVRFTIAPVTEKTKMRILCNGTVEEYRIVAVNEDGVATEMEKTGEDENVIDFDSTLMPINGIVVNNGNAEEVPAGKFPVDTVAAWLYVLHPSKDFSFEEFTITNPSDASFESQEYSVTTVARSMDGKVELCNETFTGVANVTRPAGEITFNESASSIIVGDTITYTYAFVNTSNTGFEKARFSYKFDTPIEASVLTLGDWSDYNGRVNVVTVSSGGVETVYSTVSVNDTKTVALNDTIISGLYIETVNDLPGKNNIDGMQLTGKYQNAGTAVAYGSVECSIAGQIALLGDSDSVELVINNPQPTATVEPTVTPEPTTTPEPTQGPTTTPEPTVTPDATATPEPTSTPDNGGNVRPPSVNTPVPDPTATPVPLSVSIPSITANVNSISYGDTALFYIRNLSAAGMKTSDIYVLHLIIPKGAQVKSIGLPAFGGSARVSLVYQNNGSKDVGTFTRSDSAQLSERDGTNVNYIAIQIRNVEGVLASGDVTLILKNISTRDRVQTLQAVQSVRDSTTAVREQHGDKYNIVLSGPKQAATPTPTTKPGNSGNNGGNASRVTPTPKPTSAPTDANDPLNGNPDAQPVDDGFVKPTVNPDGQNPSDESGDGTTSDVTPNPFNVTPSPTPEVTEAPTEAPTEPPEDVNTTDGSEQGDQLDPNATDAPEDIIEPILEDVDNNNSVLDYVRNAPLWQKLLAGGVVASGGIFAIIAAAKRRKKND